jgi:hypothetical protein
MMTPPVWQLSADLRTWRHVAGNNIAGNTVFLIKGYEGWWAGLTVGKILTPMTL